MRRLFVLLLILIIIGGLLFFQPGGFLVIDNPEKSDAIVVLAGDAADDRYRRGMELLRAGYAKHLLLDATTSITYGHTYADLAADFVSRTAGEMKPQVSVCPIHGDSTKEEAVQVNDCLQRLQPPPRSAIVATDDYHTRRALSIFRRMLPQYHWSAAAAHNPFIFGTPWWKNREWAKTYLTEWQKLLWWNLVDRWRD